MDCTQTQRRPGFENGPSQFHKILKYSLLVAIDDPQTSFRDCFGFVGADCHSYTPAAFKSRFDTLVATMQPQDTCIVIGGDMSALPALATDDLDLIIKISPQLSRGHLAPGKPADHSNYVTALPAATRAKLMHFGVLDYTNTQAQLDAVQGEDKAKVVFLDKLGQANPAAFASLLATLTSQTKLAVVVDCESLTPDYFPGVSDPSVFGLVETEIFAMLAALGTCEASLKTLAFANFNPAVESRRSADCLLYMVYGYLQSAKPRPAGVLAQLN